MDGASHVRPTSPGTLHCSDSLSAAFPHVQSDRLDHNQDCPFSSGWAGSRVSQSFLDMLLRDEVVVIIMFFRAQHGGSLG